MDETGDGVDLTFGLLALVACSAPDTNTGAQNPGTRNPGTQNPGTPTTQTPCTQASGQAGQDTPPSSGPAPVVASWNASEPALIKRWESQGLAAQGKLFVMGGFRNTVTNPVTATVESYTFDPATRTWKQIASMPEALTHAGQALDGDTIWIAGGFAGNYDAITTITQSGATTSPATAGEAGQICPPRPLLPGEWGIQAGLRHLLSAGEDVGYVIEYGTPQTSG